MKPAGPRRLYTRRRSSGKFLAVPSTRQWAVTPITNWAAFALNRATGVRVAMSAPSGVARVCMKVQRVQRGACVGSMVCRALLAPVVIPGAASRTCHPMEGNTVTTVAKAPGANGFTPLSIAADAPTTHQPLIDFVSQIAHLTKPEEIHWVDGSQQEYDRLTDQMVQAGTLTRLTSPDFPNSFAAASDPADVARVESRTFICSERERDAGFTNNWVEPAEMRKTLDGVFDGAMQGRTMYVIPFVMGHLEADDPKFGVEITDSPYVVASMRIMARIGT